jgi:hypothetical protein
VSIRIIGHTRDLRTNTDVLYAISSIPEFLHLVGDNFADFEIQRTRVEHRAYKRMKTDIISGALLPPITLAMKPEIMLQINFDIDALHYPQIVELLSYGDTVQILDGLQRTYILDDLRKENVSLKDGQTLLLEFWLERNIQNLIYRIIVLNAGQKPMSWRHQLELLFGSIREPLARELDINIFTERDETRRTKPRKYMFVNIVSAFQCFMQGSFDNVKENTVANALNDQRIFEANEAQIQQQYHDFKSYLSTYAKLDELGHHIYGDAKKEHTRFLPWFGSENVMNAFFAAVANYGDEETTKSRVETALQHMLEFLKSSTTGSDPLALSTLLSLTSGYNPRKVNVGHITRQLIHNGFIEYFREEGRRPFQRCWELGAK